MQNKRKTKEDKKSEKPRDFKSSSISALSAFLPFLHHHRADARESRPSTVQDRAQAINNPANNHRRWWISAAIPDSPLQLASCFILKVRHWTAGRGITRGNRNGGDGLDAEVRLRPVPTRRTGGGRFEKPISGGTEIDSMMILIIILSILIIITYLKQDLSFWNKMFSCYCLYYFSLGRCYTMYARESDAFELKHEYHHSAIPAIQYSIFHLPSYRIPCRVAQKKKKKQAKQLRVWMNKTGENRDHSNKIEQKKKKFSINQFPSRETKVNRELHL